MRGTVKWFNGQKGFGFIQPDDGGKDVFAHISAVERAGMRGLNEGERSLSKDLAARPIEQLTIAVALGPFVFLPGFTGAKLGLPSRNRRPFYSCGC